MGKKFSTTLLVIGVLLAAVAIVWWALIAPMLTKLPDDLNTTMNFEGKLTVYLDPTTGMAIPNGASSDITAVRKISSLPKLSNSKVAVIEDSTVLTMIDGEKTQAHRFALDRKTRKCVKSTENWSYAPQITLDRTGNYGLLFPGGLDAGKEVTFFSNDTAKTYTFKVEKKIDDWNGLGVTALKVLGTRETTPYYPAIAQAALVGGLKLPAEVPFAMFSAQLKAKGVDLQAVMAALADLATPAELQAMQALTQQPVKIIYSQSSADVYYIEQVTGATIGATLDRTTTMGFDAAGLEGALTSLAKYASNPTVAAALGATAGLKTAEPTKVFNQTMSIVSNSEASLVESAKEKIPLVTLVNFWIPLIVGVLGALILLLGAIGLWKPRKAAA